MIAKYNIDKCRLFQCFTLDNHNDHNHPPLPNTWHHTAHYQSRPIPRNLEVIDFVNRYTSIYYYLTYVIVILFLVKMFQIKRLTRNKYVRFFRLYTRQYNLEVMIFKTRIIWSRSSGCKQYLTNWRRSMITNYDVTP